MIWIHNWSYTFATLKSKYERSIAAEKAKQEIIRAEKQQMNNLLLMGLILVVMTSVFLTLFLRQRNQNQQSGVPALHVPTDV